MVGNVFKRIKCPRCKYTGAYIRFRNKAGNYVYECAACEQRFQRDYKKKGGRHVEAEQTGGMQDLFLDDVER